MQYVLCIVLVLVSPALSRDFTAAQSMPHSRKAEHTPGKRIVYHGSVRVVDGDTLVYGKKRVRLVGIDAPETGQWCERGDGKGYGCGKESRRFLLKRIGLGKVKCMGRRLDRYKRLLGTCYLDDGTNLNEWIVANGHALAYRRYSRRYVEAENRASREKRGMWAGNFEKPWVWRKQRR